MRLTPNRVGLSLTASVLVAVMLSFLNSAPSQTRTPVPLASEQTFPLGVDYDSTNLDDATNQIYLNVQNTLTGFTGYPNDRATFFAGYNDSNGFSLSGWGAWIHAVQANGNGFLVTVSVSPGLSSSKIGADCQIDDLAYTEQYQINNDGTFQYIASFDPNNQAGQVSALIDGY